MSSASVSSQLQLVGYVSHSKIILEAKFSRALSISIKPHQDVDIDKIVWAHPRFVAE